MGVTVHYRFTRRETPEYLLRHIEALAKKIGMKITHRSWNHLIIDPHEKSESIDLHWHKVKTIKKQTKEWSYDSATINELGELDDEMWFCSGFTKTHYAGVEAHLKVAELLRIVGAYCQKSEIYDEAGYYEKGMTKNTEKDLKEYWNDYNKSLGNLTSKLKDIFGDENVQEGG